MTSGRTPVQGSRASPRFPTKTKPPVDYSIGLNLGAWCPWGPENNPPSTALWKLFSAWLTSTLGCISVIKKVSDWFTRRRHKALVEDLKSRKLDLTGTSILNADSSLLGRTESLTVSPTKRRGPSPSSEPRLHEGSSWLRETSISTRVDQRGEEQREKK